MAKNATQPWIKKKQNPITVIFLGQHKQLKSYQMAINLTKIKEKLNQIKF